MSRALEDLLDKQAAALKSAVNGHAAHLDSLLSSHRLAVAQLVLHESPHPFVREVFESLRRHLREIIIEEAGCADAEDCFPLLRLLDRMEKNVLEGKGL